MRHLCRMAKQLSTVHAIPGPVALQLEYSLTERTIEQEHIPAAGTCGLGIVPWSPLAAGFLTGKYQRGATGPGGEGRLNGANPFGDSKFTDRNWSILDGLQKVAAETGKPPAQIALAWALSQRGITSLIIGVSKPAQLQDNIASLDVVLPPAQLQQLNDISALAPVFPYPIFTPAINKNIFGGNTVAGWE